MACEYDFLMHAILCISARHLAFLLPDKPKYSIAAADHLSRTLHAYRRDLSGNFNRSNIDALMATAVLLHYELWTETDFVSKDSDGVVIFDPVDDRLLELSIGLQQVFIHSIPLLFERPSVFVSGYSVTARERLW